MDNIELVAVSLEGTRYMRYKERYWMSLVTQAISKRKHVLSIPIVSQRKEGVVY